MDVQIGSITYSPPNLCYLSIMNGKYTRSSSSTYICSQSLKNHIKKEHSSQFSAFFGLIQYSPHLID